MYKRTCSLLGLALLAGGLSAQTVLINYGGLDFQDASGASVSDGSLVLLIANVDLGSTDFSTLLAGSIDIGSLLNSSYQVLDRTAVDSGFGTTGSVSISLQSGVFSSIESGDQLAVLWFPTLSYSSDYSLSSGVAYGLYTLTADSSWQVPAASYTIDLTVPDSVRALLTSTTASPSSAIPEPSTYALFASLGALLTAAWRRKAKKPAGLGHA